MNQTTKDTWIPITIFSLTLVWLVIIQYVTMTTPVKNYKELKSIEQTLEDRTPRFERLEKRMATFDEHYREQTRQLDSLEQDLKNLKVETKKP